LCVLVVCCCVVPLTTTTLSQDYRSIKQYGLLPVPAGLYAHSGAWSLDHIIEKHFHRSILIDMKRTFECYSHQPLPLAEQIQQLQALKPGCLYSMLHDPQLEPWVFLCQQPIQDLDMLHFLLPTGDIRCVPLFNVTLFIEYREGQTAVHHEDGTMTIQDNTGYKVRRWAHGPVWMPIGMDL